MTSLTMSAANVRTSAVSTSNIGRILSGIAVAFMIFDTAVKFTHVDAVAQSFNQLGYPLSLAATIGIIELVCLVFYLVPSTAVLGAVLLTGYLGGAVSTHVRVG